MDMVRYLVAVMLLISLPPALLLWPLIHPFARFWRRLGPVWTYSLLGLPMAAVMAALFRARRWLLATDFGTHPLLIALAALTLAAATTMSLKRRKHLTFGILAGLPELSQRQWPGRLVTEGIYAKIRHPRYVEALLGILGYALFSNYLALYAVFLLSLPVIYLIVVLEERELRERFGAAYDEYSRRVPRFLPRTRVRG